VFTIDQTGAEHDQSRGIGVVAALWLMDSPFGFMAFLGVASLVGVIVSHVIVLLDFIEEAHERGESLREDFTMVSMGLFQDCSKLCSKNR
jgi:hypothetical protein